MPTYSFKCSRQACRTEFDKLVPLADFDKEMKCPQCGAESIRQITTTVPNSSWSMWRR